MKEHDYTERSIYMLTLTVEGRRKLLGEVAGRSDADGGSEDAPRFVPTELGALVSRELEHIALHYPQIQVLGRQLMPDHLHVILFVKERLPVPLGAVVNGFKTGCRRAWRSVLFTPHSGATPNTAPHSSTRGAGSTGAARPAVDGVECPAAVQQGKVGILFERGYNDRVLYGKGQLQAMIDYIRDNPRRLLAKREHPDLFRMHRDTVVCSLPFTSLGNHFLLHWPDRQLVEVSRSAGSDYIDEQLSKVLAAARNGAVTYTAAISDGEKRIARTVREQGFPLVVLLADGFPAEGSLQERYYKPGGVYFEACSLGRLLLLEPKADVYEAPAVVQCTEDALRRKAAARHFDYLPVPHTSKRYRFIALNEIGRMLVGQ